MTDLRLVYCTFPNEETARAAGRACVAEGLAACVSVLPGVESIYMWQGKLEEAEETLTIWKTTALRAEQLSLRLGQLHPYDVPEVVVCTVTEASAPYAAWVRATCEGGAS